MLSQFLHSQNVRELHFRKRELILRAEDSLDGGYYLKSGYIRMYTISHSGEELTLAILKKGDFFPLEILVASDHNSYFFEALSSVVVFKIPSSEVRGMLVHDIKSIYNFNSEVITRFYGVLERMQFFAFGSAYGRVASILAICAERFGEKLPDGGVLIRAPLAHRDIASLVGLTRETVSVEMKKLENEGLISYSKRSRIVVKSILRIRRRAHKEA